MVKQNCDPRHRPCFGGIGVGSQPSLDNTAFRATMTRTPEFEPIDVAWGQTVILQELITQLIQSGALTVERAQRVFDAALQRTMKAAEQAPGATRFVQHVHDKLQLGDYYRAAVSPPAAWDREKMNHAKAAVASSTGSHGEILR